MIKVRWLTVEAVEAIHAELIARYGGSAGLRDRGLIDSALSRAKNKSAYENEKSVARLAAAFSWGLLKNHPFVDGNKRIALAALVTFLELNGYELRSGEAEETIMVLRAASGEMEESAWVAWIERVCHKKAMGKS